MQPVAHNDNALANPDTAILAKTADLGAASKSGKKTLACLATFFRRMQSASILA
jgi:hypothetical protein